MESKEIQGGGLGGRCMTAEEEQKWLEERAKKRQEAAVVEDKSVKGPKEQQKP